MQPDRSLVYSGAFSCLAGPSQNSTKRDMPDLQPANAENIEVGSPKPFTLTDMNSTELAIHDEHWIAATGVINSDLQGNDSADVSEPRNRLLENGMHDGVQSNTEESKDQTAEDILEAREEQFMNRKQQEKHSSKWDMNPVDTVLNKVVNGDEDLMSNK